MKKFGILFSLILFVFSIFAQSEYRGQSGGSGAEGCCYAFGSGITNTNGVVTWTGILSDTAYIGSEAKPVLFYNDNSYFQFDGDGLYTEVGTGDTILFTNDTTSLEINTDGLTIALAGEDRVQVEGVAGSQGIEYSGIDGSGFTDTSLVHVSWVQGQISDSLGAYNLNTIYSADDTIADTDRNIYVDEGATVDFIWHTNNAIQNRIGINPDGDEQGYFMENDQATGTSGISLYGTVTTVEGDTLSLESDAFTFLLGSETAVFTDNSGTTTGIEYAADYSADYVDRTLPDVAWVRGQISDSIASGVAANIYNTSDTITDEIRDVTFMGTDEGNVGHFRMNHGSVDGQLLIYSAVDGLATDYSYMLLDPENQEAVLGYYYQPASQRLAAFEASPGSALASASYDGATASFRVSGQTSGTYTDAVDSSGIEYAGIYHAGYTDRTLPDVGWIKGQISDSLGLAVLYTDTATMLTPYITINEARSDISDSIATITTLYNSDDTILNTERIATFYGTDEGNVGRMFFNYNDIDGWWRLESRTNADSDIASVIQASSEGAPAVFLQSKSNASDSVATAVTISEDSWLMQSNDYTGSQTFSMQLGHAGTVITDAVDSSGLEYAGIYHAGYTARTLPDVGWVQGQISDSISGFATNTLYNASDSIWDEERIVTFGGTDDGATANMIFNEGDDDGVWRLTTDNDGDSDYNAYFVLDPSAPTAYMQSRRTSTNRSGKVSVEYTSVNLRYQENAAVSIFAINTGSGLFTDQLDSTGIEYNGVYWSGYTDRTLPDVGWVRNEISDSVSSYGALATGGLGLTGTDFYLDKDNMESRASAKAMLNGTDSVLVTEDAGTYPTKVAAGLANNGYATRLLTLGASGTSIIDAGSSAALDPAVVQITSGGGTGVARVMLGTNAESYALGITRRINVHTGDIISTESVQFYSGTVAAPGSLLKTVSDTTEYVICIWDNTETAWDFVVINKPTAAASLGNTLYSANDSIWDEQRDVAFGGTDEANVSHMFFNWLDIDGAWAVIDTADTGEIAQLYITPSFGTYFQASSSDSLTTLGVEPYRYTIETQGDGSSQYNFVMNPSLGATTFTDAVDSSGIEYNGIYWGGYTARTLPDVGWVQAQISDSLGPYFDSTTVLSRISDSLSVFTFDLYDSTNLNGPSPILTWGVGADSNSIFGYEAGVNGITGDYNTVMGAAAGQSLTSGWGNTLIGALSGNAITTTNRNTLIGNLAGHTSTGYGGITGIGYEALGNTSGDNWATAIGYRAGASSYGEGSVMIGFEAGLGSASSDFSVNIGYEAGEISGGSLGSVYIGYQVGLRMTGDYNVGIGYGALSSLSAGDAVSNVAIGYQAGDGLTIGANNVFIGPDAGGGIGTTGNNVAVGHDAMVGMVSSQFAIAIGQNAAGDATDTGADYFIGIGPDVLDSATKKDSIIAIGIKAGASNTYAHAVLLGHGTVATADTQVVLGSNHTMKFSDYGAGNKVMDIDSIEYLLGVGTENGVADVVGEIQGDSLFRWVQAYGIDGYMGFADSSLTITATGGGTWDPITNAAGTLFRGEAAYDMTVQGDSIIVLVGGVYKIEYDFSLAGGASSTYELGVTVNGTARTLGKAEIDASDTDTKNVGAVYVGTFNANDVVKPAFLETAGTTDPTFVAGNIYMKLLRDRGK